jgi:hypothetical protein
MFAINIPSGNINNSGFGFVNRMRKTLRSFGQIDRWCGCNEYEHGHSSRGGVKNWRRKRYRALPKCRWMICISYKREEEKVRMSQVVS